MGILDAIGHTPLVELGRIVPEGSARIVAKLESPNPTGSMREGIFAGTSSGANVVAALKVAQRLGPGATVATIIVDSGLQYLSTDVYRPPSTYTLRRHSSPTVRKDHDNHQPCEIREASKWLT